MKKTPLTLALLASTIFLTACTDDGDNGQNGLNSLIQQMPLVLGNDDCWSAGTRIESGLDKNQNGELDANEIQQSSIQCGPNLFTQGVALPYQNLTSFKANGTTIASTNTQATARGFTTGAPTTATALPAKYAPSECR